REHPENAPTQGFLEAQLGEGPDAAPTEFEKVQQQGERGHEKSTSTGGRQQPFLQSRRRRSRRSRGVFGNAGAEKPNQVRGLHAESNQILQRHQCDQQLEYAGMNETLTSRLVVGARPGTSLEKEPPRSEEHTS